MSDNKINDPQFTALMQVITEITSNKVPLINERDLIGADRTTSKTIRHLQEHADNYLFDDGDLVHDLKSAIIELQYLQSVIKTIKQQSSETIKHLETEVARLERLFHRDY